ncbi:MAG: hypothetical protein H7Y04_02525 [Verrucomicrobia bacterium]|nr:hypothetical protein [Cytophagales bacterium]
MKDKPYKISFRYYFNKKLKPSLEGVVDAQGNEIEKEIYPLYLGVNFRTKTTLIRSWNDREEDLFPFDNDIEKLQADAKFSLYLKEEMRFLENIIRYEVATDENNFTLNGLGERYFAYRQSIMSLLDKKMKQILRKEYRSFARLDELAFDFSENNIRLSFAKLLRIIRKASPDFEASEDFRLKVDAYFALANYLMQNSNYIKKTDLTQPKSPQQLLEDYLYTIALGYEPSPTVLDWITGKLRQSFSVDNSDNNSICYVIDEILTTKKQVLEIA